MTLDERFRDFVELNPEVVRLFTQFAVEAKMAGRSRIGAKAIAERCRWETAVTSRGEPYKVNNDYISRLARLVSIKRPDLADMFAFRSLRS